MGLANMRCCGIKELHGLSHVRGQTAAMRQICNQSEHHPERNTKLFPRHLLRGRRPPLRRLR